jgi:hypothetical protein
MQIFLISLRTKILILFGVVCAVFIGTLGFHTTAERQIRLKFVSHHLQNAATLIAARHNHGTKYAQQVLESPIMAQTGRQRTIKEFDFDGASRVNGPARIVATAAGPISLWVKLVTQAVSANVDRDFARTDLAVVGLLLLTFALMRAGAARLLVHRNSSSWQLRADWERAIQ